MQGWVVVIVAVAYVSLLFGIASLGDRHSARFGSGRAQRPRAGIADGLALGVGALGARLEHERLGPAAGYAQLQAWHGLVDQEHLLLACWAGGGFDAADS